jgi:hypothetical protein
VTHDLPRKLNEKETALLHRLLGGSFPGVDHLRLQVAACWVVERWAPTSASIVLAVEGDVPSADLVPDGPAPIDAIVYDHAAEPIGELLLWVSAGYLSALEYGWWTDAPPVELPDAAHVVLDAGQGPQTDLPR